MKQKFLIIVTFTIVLISSSFLFSRPRTFTKKAKIMFSKCLSKCKASYKKCEKKAIALERTNMPPALKKCHKAFSLCCKNCRKKFLNIN